MRLVTIVPAVLPCGWAVLRVESTCLGRDFVLLFGWSWPHAGSRWSAASAVTSIRSDVGDAPDAAPQDVAGDAAAPADATVESPDATVEDAGEACGPAAPLSLALSIRILVEGEPGMSTSLCDDSDLHRLDGRALVQDVAPERIALRFLDGPIPQDVVIGGTLSRLALDVGAEVEAHVVCSMGMHELGHHAAVVLADASGPLLSAVSGESWFFRAGNLDAAAFFETTPFTRAQRCSVTDENGCGYTREALTFESEVLRERPTR